MQDNVPFFLSILHLLARVHAITVPPEMATFVISNHIFCLLTLRVYWFPCEIHELEVECLVVCFYVHTYLLLIIVFMDKHVVRVEFNPPIFAGDNCNWVMFAILSDSIWVLEFLQWWRLELRLGYHESKLYKFQSWFLLFYLTVWILKKASHESKGEVFFVFNKNCTHCIRDFLDVDQPPVFM